MSAPKGRAWLSVVKLHKSRDVLCAASSDITKVHMYVLEHGLSPTPPTRDGRGGRRQACVHLADNPYWGAKLVSVGDVDGLYRAGWGEGKQLDEVAHTVVAKW